jgi:hypothetical protein
MIRPPNPNESKLWRDSYYHKRFGFEAAKEAWRVLKYFEEERPHDKRPREAIDAIRAWAEDKCTLNLTEVRKLSLNAHAAARDVKSDIAKFAAHAAGQAVASWHVPTHALGAFSYAGKATIAARIQSKSAKKGFIRQSSASYEAPVN